MPGKNEILKTTPSDHVHYPATNQVHYCWQKYNEFVLCLKKNDGDASACVKAKQHMSSICPSEWVENWDTHRQNGVFLGVQEKGVDVTAGHHHHH